jgi:hypothetical protein
MIKLVTLEERHCSGAVMILVGELNMRFTAALLGVDRYEKIGPRLTEVLTQRQLQTGMDHQKQNGAKMTGLTDTRKRRRSCSV